MKFFKVISILAVVASVTLAENLKAERSKESYKGLTNAYQVKDRDSDEGTDNSSMFERIYKILAEFCERITRLEHANGIQNSNDNDISTEDGASVVSSTDEEEVESMSTSEPEPVTDEGNDVESTSAQEIISDEDSTQEPEAPTTDIEGEAADRSRSKNHSAVRARLAHGHNKSQKSHSKSKSHSSKSHSKTKNHVKGHSKLSKSHGQKKN